MTRRELTEKWAEVRDRVKAEWRALTDRDLDQIAGQEEELVRRISKKYRLPRVQVERDIARVLGDG
jgi:uncharacterized protein YjbJ (UPF0337 family)